MHVLLEKGGSRLLLIGKPKCFFCGIDLTNHHYKSYHEINMCDKCLHILNEQSLQLGK